MLHRLPWLFLLQFPDWTGYLVIAKKLSFQKQSPLIVVTEKKTITFYLYLNKYCMGFLCMINVIIIIIIMKGCNYIKYCGKSVFVTMTITLLVFCSINNQSGSVEAGKECAAYGECIHCIHSQMTMYRYEFWIKGVQEPNYIIFTFNRLIQDHSASFEEKEAGALVRVWL